VLKGFENATGPITFSSDGKVLYVLATTSDLVSDGRVRRWDLTAGKELEPYKPGVGPLLSLVLSPDGKTLALGYSLPDLMNSRSGGVLLLDAATGRKKADIQHGGPTLSVAFTRDGNTLAAGAVTFVRLIDVRKGDSLRVIAGPIESVTATAFAPDGKTLASGGTDRKVHLWNVESGEETATLVGHRGFVTGLTFSPDGQTLVSCGGLEKTPDLILWDVEKCKQRAALKGHEDMVNALAISPNGRTLATAGQDKTVRLWDAETGKELDVLRGHERGVNAVTFSPDGKTLATRSADGTVRLWKLLDRK
jgi:WD40 repeat protein